MICALVIIRHCREVGESSLTAAIGGWWGSGGRHRPNPLPLVAAYEHAHSGAEWHGWLEKWLFSHLLRSGWACRSPVLLFWNMQKKNSPSTSSGRTKCGEMAATSREWPIQTSLLGGSVIPRCHAELVSASIVPGSPKPDRKMDPETSSGWRAM